MTAPILPIGAEFSRLAELSPDEPAVTCGGRTLSRGDLGWPAPTPISVCAKATT
jgi:hypothetical protein